MNREISGDLPAGWEMKVDPRTRRPFFIDHKTRSTSWYHPRDLNNSNVERPLKTLKHPDTSLQQSSLNNELTSSRIKLTNQPDCDQSTVTSNKETQNESKSIGNFFNTPNANFQAWLNVNHLQSMATPSAVNPSTQAVQAGQTSYNPQLQSYSPQQEIVYSQQNSTFPAAPTSQPGVQPYPPISQSVHNPPAPVSQPGMQLYPPLPASQPGVQPYPPTSQSGHFSPAPASQPGVPYPPPPTSLTLSSGSYPQNSMTMANGWSSQPQQSLYTSRNNMNQYDQNPQKMPLEPFSQGPRSRNDNEQENKNQLMLTHQDRQPSQWNANQYLPRLDVASQFQGCAVNDQVHLPGTYQSIDGSSGIPRQSGMPYPNQGQNNRNTFVQAQQPSDGKLTSEYPQEHKLSQGNEKSILDQNVSPTRSIQGQSQSGAREDYSQIPQGPSSNNPGQYQQYNEQNSQVPTSQGLQHCNQSQFQQQEKPMGSVNCSQQPQSLGSVQQTIHQQTGLGNFSSLPSHGTAPGFLSYPVSQPGSMPPPAGHTMGSAQQPRQPMAYNNMPLPAGHPLAQNNMTQPPRLPVASNSVPPSLRHPNAPNSMAQQSMAANMQFTTGNLQSPGQPMVTDKQQPLPGKPVIPTSQFSGYPVVTNNLPTSSGYPVTTSDSPSRYSNNMPGQHGQATSATLPRHSMPASTSGQPTINNSLSLHRQPVAANMPQPSGQPITSSHIPQQYGQETSIATNKSQPQYGQPMTTVNSHYLSGQPVGVSGIPQQPGPQPSGQPMTTNNIPQSPNMTGNLRQQPIVTNQLPGQPYGQPIATNDPMLNNQTMMYPPVSKGNYYQQPNTLQQANQETGHQGVYPSIPSSMYQSQEVPKPGDIPGAPYKGYTSQTTPGGTVIQGQTKPHSYPIDPTNPHTTYPTDNPHQAMVYPNSSVAYPTQSYNTHVGNIPQSPSTMPGYPTPPHPSSGTKVQHTPPNNYPLSGSKVQQGNDKIRRTRIEMIDRVLCLATEMEPKVFNFNGRRGDKEFMSLEEQLTRCILDLDKIQTDGVQDIRNARKSAIRRVQYLIDTLEEKV